MSTIEPYVGPVLGLIGTLLVAALGFYQWRKQRSNPNPSEIAASRKSAAEAIWAKLEEINIAVRVTPNPQDLNLDSLKTEANVAFLKNSLYLNDDVQTLIKSYVESLFHVADLVRELKSPAASEWNTTAIMPTTATEPMLVKALSDAALLRERVKGALLAYTVA